MTIIPIREVGSACMGHLSATYEEIVSVLSLPNVTDLDDPDKVKASWGFQDETGRKGFIWCYKQDDPIKCTNWSVDGDPDLELIEELFKLKGNEAN